MVSTAAVVPLLLCLLSGSAEDGSHGDHNSLSDNLLKAAGIFKAAQVTLKENVLALQKVLDNFNSLMGTMQTVSQSFSLTVREMKTGLTLQTSGGNGNTCKWNLTLPTVTTCNKNDGVTELHIQTFMSQLKSISQTLQSSETSLSEIKSDDLLVRDCWDIYKSGRTQNGMYRIWPKLWKFIGSFYVYCDMESHNGGWTVLHRRHEDEPVESFNKSWNDYMFGFGDLLSENFWLGNEKICVLTQQREYQLMVTLWDKQNNSIWAKHNVFHVAQKNQHFKLHVGEYTSGLAGNIMGAFNNRAFSTVDSDHTEGKCAQKYSTGWWFYDCRNRLWDISPELKLRMDSITSFKWLPINGRWLSISRFEMKIKPIQ